MEDKNSHIWHVNKHKYVNSIIIYTSVIYFDCWLKISDLVLPIILSEMEITNSIEQSPSWEADRFLANQEILPHFMESEGLLPHLEQPATCESETHVSISYYGLVFTVRSC